MYCSKSFSEAYAAFDHAKQKRQLVLGATGNALAIPCPAEDVAVDAKLSCDALQRQCFQPFHDF